MDISWATVGLTLLSVVFSVGLFTGVTRVSLKSIERQLQELKDDNKIISGISTTLAVISQRVDGLEKCQDHIQQDMVILKKRNIRKTED